MGKQYSVSDLLDIMQQLRDPETGCSWDQVQTFQTIVPYTVEEAYEVADAISRKDMPDLCDELGDLLLQVVYHAQMAKEQGSFMFDDVVNAICEKMVRRHPHVFGDDKQIARGKQDWELFKQQERATRGKPEEHSAIANIAQGLPPLLRARKMQKKAAKVGFDWSEITAVIDKLREELDELEEEISNANNQQHVEEEIGDVLFSVVNVCRHVNVDADVALQKANNKFEKRFKCMEGLIAQQNDDFLSLTESQLDGYWNQAKKCLQEN